LLRALLAAGAMLALGGCAVSPEEDPVQIRLNDLDSRVGRIDRIVSNQSLMQMTQRVDSLQEEVRTLRGRIEELQNDNAVLKKQQRDLYADLDRRLTEAVAAAPAPTAPESDELALYNRALEQLRARNYVAAVDGFRALAASHPTGQVADNTQYWLGEAYYVTAEYDQAAAAFQRVLSGWPNSRKAADALLKLGYTQIEQNKLAAARATLQQVVAKHPDSDAAKLAAERLTKLPK
jgi:tol-pal system protein YbgF